MGAPKVPPAPKGILKTAYGFQPKPKSRRKANARIADEPQLLPIEKLNRRQKRRQSVYVEHKKFWKKVSDSLHDKNAHCEKLSDDDFRGSLRPVINGKATRTHTNGGIKVTGHIPVDRFN